MRQDQTLRLCLASRAFRLALVGGVTALYAPSLFAETTLVEARDDGESDTADNALELEEVIVDGSYLKGSSLSEFEPELVLTKSDIAAYGVSSIAELLEIIEVETSSGKQRRSEPPVVLINGRRVSGFRELDNYPVEALARVEVLPEEASLAYGFTANQRVINFILEDDLQIIPINTRTQAPKSGGTLSNVLTVSRVKIDGPDRFTLRGQYSASSPLLESERSIIPFATTQAPSSRSLLPETESYEISALKSFALPDDALGTLSLRFEDSETTILTGLSPLDASQLSQDIGSQTVNFGLTINSKLAANTWSAVASYDHADRSFENIGNLGATFDPVETTSSLFKADLNGNFSVSQTDFGAITASGALGVRAETYTDGADSTDLSRDTAYVQAALSVPLPLEEERFGRGSLSIDGQLSDISDVGTLSDYGVTANWIPIEGLTLTYSWASEEIAPTLFELGLPQSFSPNRALFDLAEAETVVTTVVDGGNPDLSKTSRTISKLGASWTPWEDRKLTFGTNYIVSESTDDIRSFTIPTARLDESGLGLAVRDQTGALTLFDRTPINVSKVNSKSLRNTLSWSIPIKAKLAKTPPKRKRSGRPGTRRLSIVHRWELENEVELGLADITLDLLNGDTIDSNLATPKHALDVTYYRWNNGWGFYGSVQYRSGGSLDTGTDELTFSETVRVILSGSYEFNYSDPILDRFPILEETRLTIGLANALNDVVTVENSLGQTPLAYQPDVLDPVGLGWRIELRKRF
ncbi:MAG: hypothetical protein AAGI14_02265 [Pseudomonadota bacterium]